MNNLHSRASTRAAGWLRQLARLAVVVAAIQLVACGDDVVQVTGTRQGVTPFIAFVELTYRGLPGLASARFSIAPKTGSYSKPVLVEYSAAALARKGYLTDSTGGSGTTKITIPVFGLYAGYANQVSLQLTSEIGDVISASTVITTPAYTDPNGIYDHPNILIKRAAGTKLGFEFFLLKSGLGTPLVLDADGEIRWVATGITNSQSTVITEDGFLTGDSTKPVLYQLGFDGTLNAHTLQDSTLTNFHHNIDPGKQGVLGEVNATVNGVANVESVIVELASDGTIIKKWDMAAIISSYMQANGDDASTFVRPGTDWFHMNASTYDPADDTLIVSSRENFLIKIDYNTGNIVWILGDPNKYWYTFPSLRAKALSLQGSDLFPIGQHAVSITSDKLVMIFDDGLGSRNQPTGQPAGYDLTYSAVSAYSIDGANFNASLAWRYDHDLSIYSSICSSAYEAPGGSLLVDYATASGITETRLMGLDADHNVVFDFSYPTTGCNTAWNSIPIRFDDMLIP